jgi:hypothetical protein
MWARGQGNLGKRNLWETAASFWSRGKMQVGSEKSRVSPVKEEGKEHWLRRQDCPSWSEQV